MHLAAATTTSPSTPTSTTTSHRPPSSWLLWLDPRSLFYQQSLEIQAVGKDVISDIVPPHAEMVQSYWVLPLQCQLHSLQMCVHTYIHTCDGAVYNRAIFEFNRHCLVVQLHQEPNELHLGS